MYNICILYIICIYNKYIYNCTYNIYLSCDISILYITYFFSFIAWWFWWFGGQIVAHDNVDMIRMFADGCFEVDIVTDLIELWSNIPRVEVLGLCDSASFSWLCTCPCGAPINHWVQAFMEVDRHNFLTSAPWTVPVPASSLWKIQVRHVPRKQLSSQQPKEKMVNGEDAGVLTCHICAVSSVSWQHRTLQDTSGPAKPCSGISQS